jgi:four helix bundle protein
MNDFYSLEKLEVFQLSNEIGEIVWDIVSGWQYFEKDTIGKQLVKSADSISANIAEGYGRYFFKENIQFCYYARGSLLETKVWITKACRRNMLKKEIKSDLNVKIDKLLIKLNGYINYLKKQCKTK